MNKKPMIALLAALLPGLAAAHTIQVGEMLPSAAVSDKGEITLQGDDIVYQNWNSSQLPGKVRVIQAIAGRSSAKEMNAELMQAITAAGLPAEEYQTTTIINQDDAIWGTGSFVASSAEDSKRDFSWSSMVLDAEGGVHATWELQEESSAIIVLDKESKVLFVKEGKLSPSEIEQALSLVKANL
ncbi:YtfJ family protein [Photobacterium sp. OFAV2-7]|uniref:YtfJ family protein n=1 Tax=Photobacterium sp. OFAV2-7 TaxID=2917748 RepID=UPI001EF738A0|nr:YtfJ family protein [Photobacterium sp. OFAV2-7]MCG7587743.1 YtfJ family protein [Photobacterium sp. OFAV2-7]